LDLTGYFYRLKSEQDMIKKTQLILEKRLLCLKFPQEIFLESSSPETAIF